MNWLLLAAAPASLFFSTLSFVICDVSPIPLLYYEFVPLYLLSFVLAFACWPVCWSDWPHKIMLILDAFLVPMMLILLSKNLGVSPLDAVSSLMWQTFEESGLILMLSLPTLAFFVTAVVCHGELARDQPDGWRLVEFWAWILAGAAVGVMFNRFIAPIIFTYATFEYPLAFVAACVAVFSAGFKRCALILRRAWDRAVET